MPESFGAWLNKMRGKEGISLRHAATRGNYDDAILCRLENEQVDPLQLRVSALPKLAKAYNTTITALLLKLKLSVE